MKYCFVFVCQQGELELKSMLLAASLKRFLNCDYECVAAIPQPTSRWGTIADNTLTFMQKIGVRLAPITNRIDEQYPIGNKIACLGIDSQADRIVFLDSDMLCVREFCPDQEPPVIPLYPQSQWLPTRRKRLRISKVTPGDTNSVFAAPFNAKPADLATFGRDLSIWEQVYQLFDLPLPRQRCVASVSGELMLPYFNAGMIAIHNELNFAHHWEACCRKIDAATEITNKRPWLDQIALPITVAELNLAYHCLDERFNYPVHLKPLSQPLPFFCHYHWPWVLRRQPQLNRIVAELAKTYPLLKNRLSKTPDWAQLLQPYTLYRSRCRSFSWGREQRKKVTFNYQIPEAIITGIPRSGTSYLCRLLHTVQNCVVINEPTQIFAPLKMLYPWQIALYYQDLRRDILNGQPVENKLYRGQVIEDTAVIDDRNFYLPRVSRPDFLLCTKNTLAYVARLTHLKYVMPQVPIIACVRHPLDAIASWKSSFAHLERAAVTEFAIGYLNDPLLEAWQQQHLQEIADTESLALKRALLWRYLAECVLRQRQQMILIRYEDLLEHPGLWIKIILQQIPHAPPACYTEKITASSARKHKRSLLDDEDIQAISDICGQYATELGY